ncbi:MAG: hypothetical protein E6Y83_01155 [Clostridium butyricum]|nr:hypothetical protein [Clostridium butyricum]
MDSILKYVSKEYYENACKSLKNGQTINLYSSKTLEIDLKKIGTKIYKFISHYGDDDINNCLEDMYLRCNKIAI